jgi:hypothetical protein
MFQKISMALAIGFSLFCMGQAQADEFVRGYFRSNGTYVAPHYRSSPDGNFFNNWSTYPNINPYTGQMGTRLTPPSSSRSTLPSFGLPSYSLPSYRTPSFSPSYGWRK